jgi:hypothetical protein
MFGRKGASSTPLSRLLSRWRERRPHPICPAIAGADSTDAASDPERQGKAKVPADIACQTTPQIAPQMLRDTHAADIPLGVVLPDVVLCRSPYRGARRAAFRTAGCWQQIPDPVLAKARSVCHD